MKRIGLAVTAVGLVGAVAYALSGDTTADLVLGQPDFTSHAWTNRPGEVAVDSAGNVYVAHPGGNRVLGWTAASLANGAAPTLVIGQPDFTSTAANRGGSVGADTLYIPWGLAVDPSDNLYVSDNGNNRVLEFDKPFETDTSADRVFGQPDLSSANFPDATDAQSFLFPGAIGYGKSVLWVADLSHNRVLGFANPLTDAVTADFVFGQPDFTSNAPGTTASTLRTPWDVAIDGSGNLYVSDYENNRVLMYAAPLQKQGQSASIVLGQPDLNSGTANNGGVTASSLNAPEMLFVDAAGHLYVADPGNNRVLQYTLPLSTNEPADLVFGQPTFTTNSCCFDSPGCSGPTASSLCAPSGVCGDPNSNLWIGDRANYRILRYDEPIIMPTPTPGGGAPSDITCAGLPATIVGTAADDLLVGTDGDDVIHGLPGNDIIKGRGGSDVICGGAGNDVLRGNGGDDFLKGGGGNDELHGGRGSDVLRGGKDDDVLDGGDGDDDCVDNKGTNSFTACE